MAYHRSVVTPARYQWRCFTLALSHGIANSLLGFVRTRNTLVTMRGSSLIWRCPWRADISTFTNIETLDVASVIVSLYNHNQGWYAGCAVLHLYDPRSIKFGWMQSQHFRRESYWSCFRLQHSPELEASTASAVEALWSCDTFNLLLGRTGWSHCVCIVKVN